MDFSVPMYYRTLDTTLLWLCSLLSRNLLVELALKPKRIPQDEMRAMRLQSVERVLQTLGLHLLLHFAAVKENRSLACACYPTYTDK